jgi:DNA-binding CsgD family transcriptional regulator
LSVELLESLATITTSIFETADRMSLREALKFGCSALGFERFTLTCHSAPGRELVLDHTLSTVDSSFMRDYDHFNWFDCDPNARRIVAGDGPFFWNTRLDRYADVRNRSYIDFLHSSRMRTGLLIPLPHRPRTLSVMGMSTSGNHSFPRETVLAATIMANAGMAKAEMLGLCPQFSVDEAVGIRLLSNPQMEILKWIAEGKSNLVIATIAGLNVRAVRYHVAEILRKLGVATRTQAAAILMSSKLRPRGH